MRNLIFILIVFAGIGFGSCTKDRKCDALSVTAPQEEVDAVAQYLDKNNITATKDAQGFFYTIEASGSGDRPKSCSNVTVTYTGKLTNGTVIDDKYSKQSISFDLGDLIVGWRAGIPLIAKGGRVTLYLPPSLAYGDKPTGPIPANSILIFTIDLLKINN
ncbi:FKBP-type peptidyl-prolyl cis-trans isomerase [Taibaiella chishuiensis]|uniref:Peptidyl-prolyl cis-trans isomerase n=1 Tax=Taibaiella chishuiensis TaxID=1434707 RepID=A0A2P8DA96_9BACT|nr:FKBP-type peptidyl-prolyl cis-trans isomerase [Taibaiella chishuiensis]PSK94101.1 FKBP-type peptidyl-prolyl cis-trans isomerase FkpA [Taibaiella chishuiensis]